MTFVTTIGTQKTPANPVDILFGPSLGLPTVPKGLVLIGQMGPTAGAPASGVASGTAVPYAVVPIVSVGSVAAASAECLLKFGSGSTLLAQVVAAVTANAAGPNYPPITCIPLPQNATVLGNSMTTLDTLPGILFVATPFDGSSDTANRTALINEVTLMSGAQRTSQAQYGSFAVMANTTQATIASLPAPNSQFFVGVYFYDSAGNPYSVAQVAAATAAIMAANPVPFNGLNGVAIPGMTAPVNQTDWLGVGGGLASEAVLNKGWTPLKVLPNGTVAFVRTVTSRIFLADGVTPATAYYDVQDFVTLYFFRNTIATRFAQPDFQNHKASSGQAKLAKGEVLRLMQVFEDQTMFQAVAQLSSQVIVQTNASQRGRFDVYIPVNVVPNLNEIATDIVATTQFDAFTA